MDNILKKQGSVGGVKYCSQLTSSALPLIVTFAPASTYLTKADARNPWGFDFLKKHQSVNIISFECEDTVNWYRSKEFEDFVCDLGGKIKGRFKEVLGYGGSMGGFALGAYGNALNIDRLLLINPISTLNRNTAHWENRWAYADKYNWDSAFHDLSDLKATGYIVYDPTFEIDKRHADRYTTLTPISTRYMNHGVLAKTNKLGVLTPLVHNFIKNTVDVNSVYQGLRSKRQLHSYYVALLMSQKMTPLRRKIVHKHQNMIKGFDSPLSTQELTLLLKKASISLKDTNPKLSLQLMSHAYYLKPQSKYIAKSLKELALLKS